jgi:hypothetical protein
MTIKLLYLAFSMFSFSNQRKLIESHVLHKALLSVRSSSSYAKEYHIIGVVKESKRGVCGKKCIGGYIKITLQRKLIKSKDKDIYVITGCGEIEKGSNINLIVTQLKGDEPECVYRKYFRPKNQTSGPFYRIIRSCLN